MARLSSERWTWRHTSTTQTPVTSKTLGARFSGKSNPGSRRPSACRLLLTSSPRSKKNTGGRSGLRSTSGITTAQSILLPANARSTTQRSAWRNAWSLATQLTMTASFLHSVRMIARYTSTSTRCLPKTPRKKMSPNWFKPNSTQHIISCNYSWATARPGQEKLIAHLARCGRAMVYSATSSMNSLYSIREATFLCRLDHTYTWPPLRQEALTWACTRFTYQRLKISSEFLFSNPTRP